jgi:hypothetical protein
MDELPFEIVKMLGPPGAFQLGGGKKEETPPGVSRADCRRG